MGKKREKKEHKGEGEQQAGGEKQPQTQGDSGAARSRAA